jgi:hypothetical protein
MSSGIPSRFFLSPKGAEFVLANADGDLIREFPTIAAAVDHLQSVRGDRGSVLFILNEYGRPQLVLNL